MGRHHWLFGLAVLGALLVPLHARVASALPKEESTRLVWKWSRFRTSEYVTTAVVGSAALGVFFFVGLRDEPRWTGGFTAAGLSCAHHAYVKLYGNATADALACAGSITLGAATGTFRVLGDRHYASDVLVGALVGFGFGYGMPTLLHYTAGPEPRKLGFSLLPSSSGVTLGASGRF